MYRESSALVALLKWCTIIAYIRVCNAQTHDDDRTKYHTFSIEPEGRYSRRNRKRQKWIRISDVGWTEPKIRKRLRFVCVCLFSSDGECVRSQFDKRRKGDNNKRSNYLTLFRTMCANRVWCTCEIHKLNDRLMLSQSSSHNSDEQLQLLLVC